MSQATLLREARSKHLLQNSAAAAKQFRAFKAVLPISTKNLESSSKSPKNKISSSNSAPDERSRVPDEEGNEHQV